MELQDAAGPRQGPSMVKQHHEMLQAEKEEAGIAKLQASLPKLSAPVLAIALKECNLDAERALLMLRQFQSDVFDDLASIHRKRRRLEAASHESAPNDKHNGKDEHKKRKRHHNNDDGEEDHKKKSRHKEKKKSKRSKHRERKDKRKKRRPSESGGESAGSGGSEDEQLEFGSFGIIRESDYTLKKPEFAAWASEVQRIDIESLPRGDERELWRTFMEDFNTCTLPSRKYYDLAAHARKLAAQAAASGVPDEKNTAVDDERLRRQELMAEHRKAQEASARSTMAQMMLSQEHLNELKQREIMQLQAQEAYKTGDMSKAAKLMKQLNPDEEETLPKVGYEGGY